jgi:hypothetical protein
VPSCGVLGSTSEENDSNVAKNESPDASQVEAPGDVVRARTIPSDKRRRSESNRRWRICNQEPRPDYSEENADFSPRAAPGAAVDAEIPLNPPAAGPQAVSIPDLHVDPDLALIVNRWPTLSEATKAAIVEMVRSEKKV